MVNINNSRLLIGRYLSGSVQVLKLGDPELGAGRRADTAHPGLLVAASLLEKAPNLGGLARTCEILGAGGLVLPRSVYCVPY